MFPKKFLNVSFGGYTDNAIVSPCETRCTPLVGSILVSTELGNSDIKYLEIPVAIQDYPSAICAVWGCAATTANSNYQTPCIREHWSTESIVSPPLCTYTRGGYVQRERPLGRYHPIGWLGRGSDYRLHPGTLVPCTLAKSNRMPVGTAGVCEEIVTRSRIDTGRYGTSGRYGWFRYLYECLR